MGSEDRLKAAREIEKILNTLPKEYHFTKEDATNILQGCGILDENGEIVDAYKDILVKRNGVICRQKIRR